MHHSSSFLYLINNEIKKIKKKKKKKVNEDNLSKEIKERKDNPLNSNLVETPKENSIQEGKNNNQKI